MLPYAKSPESLGISSLGIDRFLSALQEAKGVELHGLLLVRHGQVACEMAWAPYSNETPHMLFSLTKSFTSTAVGFAVSEGKLSLDDRVADLLPDKLPEMPSDALQKITVRHLLCMGSGLDPKSDDVQMDAPDWAKYALSFGVVHEPGTTFHYNSMGSHLLSVIVQRVTGETLLSYLTPRLFAPLGIATPRWETDPMGQNTGGFGLWLTTRDIALFGQLLLQDGLWEGRQLLPEGWVQEATSEQISTDASRQGEWAQGYGYQFWRCQNGYYRGDGMMGQICWVLQAQDAVIAITAAAEDMGKEMELLQEHLIPAIDAPGADEAVQQALVARIKALSHPITLGGGALPAGIAGTYVAEDGAGITVSVEGDVLALALFSKELPMPFTLRFGAAELYNGDLTIPMPMPQRMACQAGYRYEDGILTVMLRALGSPLSFKAVFKVAPDGLTGAIGGWPFTREEQTYRRA